MGVTKCVLQGLPSKPHPIKVETFVNALSSLAISGGVDSMALAVLCSLMKNALTRTDAYRELPDHFPLKVDFKAFVVDHGVRDGSSHEAEAVANVLEERGISTQVLKIEWPGGNSPKELSNFESLARKYRYQALGQACLSSGINSLLVAHHQDDQAEGVLMRLINGHRKVGLGGMKNESGIPECDGIHGVYESGNHEYLVHTPNGKSIHRSTKFSLENERSQAQLLVETGGVRIYRPLLGMSKESLIATCEFEWMEWFEDHTNKDPSLTTRNAIRHISTLTERIVAKCEARNFETRSGKLSVRFPDLSTFPFPPGTTEKEKTFIAAKVIRRFTDLVTPAQSVAISALHKSVQWIFPELFQNPDMRRPSAFTIGGVQFDSVVRFTSTISPLKPTWVLSREVPKASPLSDHLQTLIPPSKFDLWSPWFLYDRRFWICLNNRTENTLLIRLLQPSDIAQIRDKHPKVMQKLENTLKRLAPGKIRWSLPVILWKGAHEAEDTVVALPTLDWNCMPVKGLLKWKIRYKKIYTEGMSECINKLAQGQVL
ncbi:hypothetical protein G7Y89_g10131 [Cudoniella acicularis]|uniref:tRNA(Ile)-lysidine synthetase n=1 Tax=Cudoniella acicularis TaxID=354080 RepID=A0A8H4VZC4_9HELO|nr:hypothetical protein G7Y89_g10131 [Cudoniella acicularis]